MVQIGARSKLKNQNLLKKSSCKVLKISEKFRRRNISRAGVIQAPKTFFDLKTSKERRPLENSSIFFYIGRGMTESIRKKNMSEFTKKNFIHMAVHMVLKTKLLL